MELQKRYVAYIDILGFSKYVKDNVLSPEKPLELLNQFIITAKKFSFKEFLMISAFSDNIVISLPADDDKLFYTEYSKFLMYINHVQLFITTNIGVLPIRGGITCGDFYHNEILFGEAMIEAYNLEHLHAFFPRIVVNPKFLNPHRFLSDRKSLAEMDFHSHVPIEIPKYEPEILKRQYQVKYDFDGLLICNYLSALYFFDAWATISEKLLNKHKNFILMNLQNSNDLNVSRKYIWMKNYHNWFCEPFEDFQKFIIPD